MRRTNKTKKMDKVLQLYFDGLLLKIGKLDEVTVLNSFDAGMKKEDEAFHIYIEFGSEYRTHNCYDRISFVEGFHRWMSIQHKKQENGVG